MEIFLRNGFALREDIIKFKHNCKSTPRWRNTVEKYNFMMIMHEHLFVFRKPKRDEDLSRIRYSLMKI